MLTLSFLLSWSDLSTNDVGPGVCTTKKPPCLACSIRALSASEGLDTNGRSRRLAMVT